MFEDGLGSRGQACLHRSPENLIGRKKNVAAKLSPEVFALIVKLVGDRSRDLTAVQEVRVRFILDLTDYKNAPMLRSRSNLQDVADNDIMMGLYPYLRRYADE